MTRLAAHLRAFGRDFIRGRYMFALGMLAAVYAVEFARPYFTLRTVLISLIAVAAVVGYGPTAAGYVTRKYRISSLTSRNGVVR